MKLYNSSSRVFFVSLFLIVLSTVATSRLGRSSAQTNNEAVTIVSAASYDGVVTPDSIATVFGAKLSTQTATAGSLPLPTSLGGTTLRINGEAAPLLFVSPSQINFLVPPGVPAGSSGVVITAGDGVVSSGVVRITSVAPAIFTADSSGRGPLAAVLLRIKPDGRQSYESITRYDDAEKKIVTRAIDLGEDGDQLFLILFLTGVRGAAPNQIRVHLGGLDFAPLFAGAVPGLVGLDQINLALPRNLAGRGRVSLFVQAAGYGASNAGEVEIGSRAALAGGNPPLRIAAPGEPVLAGEELELSGAGFAANPRENTLFFVGDDGAAAKAEVLAVSAGAMRVRVPFGAATGTIKLLRGPYEATAPIRLRTSISGFVEEARRQDDGQLARVPVAGARVRLGGKEALTDEQGSFVLPDIAATGRAELEILAPATGALLKRLKLNLRANGDTPLPRGDEESFGNGSPFPAEQPANFTLAFLEPGRTPADLPVGHFSTRIARIAPLGQPISPGAKLSFPNKDGIATGASVALFKLDQKPGSETLGQFIRIGNASVAADGRRIETAAGAITEGGYFFASIERPTATITGRVIEADGRPAPRAIVQLRGQSVVTDGFGGFALRRVPVLKASEDRARIEVSYQRPDGRVSRKDAVEVGLTAGAHAALNPAIVLDGETRNFPPVILAPAELSLIAGDSRTLDFIVSDPDNAGAPQLSLSGSATPFTSLGNAGDARFQLRLTPNVAGAYSLDVTATDSAGARASQKIAVTVHAKNDGAPAAHSQSVTMAEDTPRNLTLTGTAGSNGGELRFAIVRQPSRGSLSGAPPNLTYTPSRDFNGADGFTFKAMQGSAESRVETVAIAVSPVNDAPVLTAPGAQIVNPGEPFSFVISASDVDGDASLRLSAVNLPPGATFAESGGVARRFSWTPSFTQAGGYTISFTATDGGAPALSASRGVTLTVGPKWAKTSGPEGGAVERIVSNGSALFSPIGNSLYRSMDGGRTWVELGGLLANEAIRGVLTRGATLIAYTNHGPSVSSRLYRSTDHGQTWTRIAFVLPPNGSVNGTAILGNRLFLGVGGGGVYATDDDGLTWNSVLGYSTFNSIEGVLIGSLVAAGNHLLAFSVESVLRSSDGGLNWRKLEAPKSDPDSPTRLGESAYNGSTLLAIATQSLYRSDNLGDSWSRLATEFDGNYLAGLLTNGKTFFVRVQNGLHASDDNGQTWTRLNGPWGKRSVIYSSVANNVVYASTADQLYRSADNGRNWSEAKLGVTISTVYELTPAGGALLARTNASLHRSLDSGQSWRRVEVGSEVQSVWSLAPRATVLFAATDVGLHRSLDNGQTWGYANLGSRGKSAGLISTNGTIHFAREGETIYRSTDTGQSWSPIGAGLQNVRANSITNDGLSWFAGTREGVYRSDDGGLNWTASNEGIKDANIFRVERIGNALFAFEAGPRIYRSADNGRSWTKLDPGATNGLPPQLAHDGKNLFLGIQQHIYRSTDLGQTWSRVTSVEMRGNVTVLKFHGSNLYATTSDPFDNANNAIWVSADNGASWREIGGGLHNKPVHSLSIKDDAIYAGTGGGGVYRLSNSNQSWSAKNAGVTNLFANSLIASGGDLFVGAFGSGVFRSSDQGESWSPANRGLPATAIVQSLATNGRTLWAALFDEGIYRSTDQGASWTAVNRGGQGGQGLTNRFVNRLFVNGGALYAGTNGGVFRSLDGGASWSAVNAGLTSLRVVSFALYNGMLYAGADGGGVFRLDGAAWQAVNRGLANLSVTALAVNGDAIYAGSNGGGVSVSRDGGQTWAPANDGLPADLNVFAFAASGRKLYAGSVHGVFVSEDEGQSWRQINAGLAETHVTGLSVSGDLLFVSTARGGVFSSRIP